jgi:hypothetical protein
LGQSPSRDANTARAISCSVVLTCRVCDAEKRFVNSANRTIQKDDEEEERTRIVYFCAKCQRVNSDSAARSDYELRFCSLDACNLLRCILFR